MKIRTTHLYIDLMVGKLLSFTIVAKVGEGI